MINLYDSTKDEKLQALRSGGFNRDNISWRVQIYEASDGTLKASISPRDKAKNGRSEHIGFWIWCSRDEYEKAQDGKDNISEQIEAGFGVNLRALKEML